MTAPSHTHHAIDYIEIYVTDMDRAKEFYHAAFDWEFNAYGAEYAGIKRRSGESGGLCLVESVTPGGCLVILYSNDLLHTQNRVIAAGGTISKDIFSFPGGRRFHFRDPFANELAVWSDDAETA